jgi:hypothetical protein
MVLYCCPRIDWFEGGLLLLALAFECLTRKCTLLYGATTKEKATMADDQVSPLQRNTTVPSDNRQPQVATNPGSVAQNPTDQDTTTARSDQTAPANRPIAVNGAAVVPAAQQNTTTLADGKQVTASTLYSAGGITISRENVNVGISPVDGQPTGNPDQFANTVVITTGNANDKVNVSQRKVGSSDVLDVDVNGQKFQITLAPGQELGVRTGDGNDVITAASNVTVAMDVRAGAGNDTVTTGQGNDRVDGGLGNDTIKTNGGRDDVYGNSGDDTIDAGDGHDHVLGGDGNDTIRGGRGRDYLDGGQGNDVIEGGSGNDILVGGQGDDTLRSQGGNDRVYTGAGKDKVENAAGNDVVYGQSEDTLTAGKGAKNDLRNVDMTQNVGSSITIQGSPEFQQRVQSDMDFLRSSPEGRGLLAEIDAAAARNPANTVTITEMTNEHNGFAVGGGFFRNTPNATGNPTLILDAQGRAIAGPGTASTIAYNPSSNSDQFPVSVGTLFHELSHAYNHVTGTMYPGAQTAAGRDNGVSFAEHQAVGLPGTPAPHNFPGGSGPSNTNPFTENDLRTEMGLPLRPSYVLPSTWNGGLGSPTAMAPTGTGGTQLASTGDPMLDRMVAAAQSGNLQDLRTASGNLYERDGAQFKEQGVSDLNRVQSNPPQTAQPEVKPLQIESPETPANARSMRQ